MKTETFSYIPALTSDEVASQAQYFLKNGWVPGIEYSASPTPELAYWGWWKLPMFSASSSQELQVELDACKDAHPNAYIRITAYDNIRQCQVMSFVVHVPT
jgi:ribulose-bisphosphate carboxylase small chain